MEFYSRIVKSADQLSYYTSGVGTFVKPTSNMKHMRMWVKNKWAAAVARWVVECAPFPDIMLKPDSFVFLVTSNPISCRDIDFSLRNTKRGIKYSYWVGYSCIGEGKVMWLNVLPNLVRIFSRSVSSEGSSSYDHKGIPLRLLNFYGLIVSAQVGLLRTGNNEQIPLWDTNLSPLRSSPR